MHLSFGLAIIVGIALQFFIGLMFPKIFAFMDMREINITLSFIIGAGVGLFCGLYVRYRVLTDNHGARAIETLGLYLGFAIGYALCAMSVFGMPVSSGVVMIVTEVLIYLIFYQRAVSLRRSRKQ